MSASLHEHRGKWSTACGSGLDSFPRSVRRGADRMQSENATMPISLLFISKAEQPSVLL